MATNALPFRPGKRTSLVRDTVSKQAAPLTTPYRAGLYGAWLASGIVSLASLLPVLMPVLIALAIV